jgi:hypothetical protein
MKYTMPDRLPFLEDALQGLAFWIGHRRAYYHQYPLAEAALIAETCNLIQSKISANQILRPEVLYRRLADTSKTKGLSKLCRADLVILDSNSPDPYENNAWEAVQFVFEVKRASASKAQIDQDLQRLYHFKMACRPGVRAFLIIASEADLPERFVDPEKGVSRLQSHKIPKTPGMYHIRRTVKAACSFKDKENAHFVCICEVFSEIPQKNLPEV